MIDTSSSADSDPLGEMDFVPSEEAKLRAVLDLNSAKTTGFSGPWALVQSLKEQVLELLHVLRIEPVEVVPCVPDGVEDKDAVTVLGNPYFRKSFPKVTLGASSETKMTRIENLLYSALESLTRAGMEMIPKSVRNKLGVPGASAPRIRFDLGFGPKLDQTSIRIDRPMTDGSVESFPSGSTRVIEETEERRRSRGPDRRKSYRG